MIDRREQNAWKDLQERYEAYCEEFKNKRMTEAVFKAKLKGLGYTNREIETEVNLNWPE